MGSVNRYRSDRGDASTAVLAFRRGLDVARRELMITGEVSLDRAIVTFSRKLGQALEASGDQEQLATHRRIARRRGDRAHLECFLPERP